MALVVFGADACWDEPVWVAGIFLDVDTVAGDKDDIPELADGGTVIHTVLLLIALWDNWRDDVDEKVQVDGVQAAPLDFFLELNFGSSTWWLIIAILRIG